MRKKRPPRAKRPSTIDKDQGYTLESLREEYKRYGVLNKIADIMVQDATVTDQEVEDLYQSLVAADKELYENDIAAYEAYNSYVDQMAMYAALYGTSSNLDHAWYKPDGSARSSTFSCPWTPS